MRGISLLIVLILTGCAFPSSTSTPEAQATSGPDSSVYYGKPPAPLMTIDDRSQNAANGSYCWIKEKTSSGPVNVCADYIGIPSPQQPLVTHSPFVAHLALSVPIPPESLDIQVIPVTLEDHIETKGEPDVMYWQAGQTLQDEDLSLQVEQDVSFSLEPGVYVLSLNGRWSDLGSAMYGFLIEVQ